MTDSATKTITLTCPTPTKKVLSGGSQVLAGSNEAKIAVIENYPETDNQWTVRAVETTNVASNWTLTAYIICGSA